MFNPIPMTEQIAIHIAIGVPPAWIIAVKIGMVATRLTMLRIVHPARNIRTMKVARARTGADLGCTSCACRVDRVIGAGFGC